MNGITMAFLVVALAGCVTELKTEGKQIKKEAAVTIGEKYAAVKVDSQTFDTLNSIISELPAINANDIGEMNAQISQQFLGVPYVGGMLVGSAIEPEKLIVDFRGLDCITYLEYVEALRMSKNKDDFVENLIQTRYVKGDVHFLTRRHFFTDWSHSENELADDVTSQLSPHAVKIVKNLNRKKDGGKYLLGLPVVQRSVVYIPSDFVDKQVLGRLHTGDYIGIYTKLSGLDVTHAGLFIQTPKGPVLRHASSSKKNLKVVDSPFQEYISKAPGIVVLRAKENQSEV
ncbi:MAG: hypothetical protein RL571_2927 [Pseudomonadota bacterium]|jgi:hypothetical protein